MHDLLVSFSLLFFVTAVFAIMHMLYIEHRMTLFGFGMICLAVSVASAIMYYGNAFTAFLAVAQKLTFVASAGWLLPCHYVESQTNDVAVGEGRTIR